MSRLLLILSFILAVPYVYASEEARNIYQQYSDRVYQVRVIEIASGNKSSIGSAFQISSDGLLATNYHVVSDVVLHPEKYRIEFMDKNSSKGDLVLEDVDVINDLALVRKKKSAGKFLELALQMPRQGEAIYSMGNPLDLGSSVVPGTYNGYIKKAYYQRLHFTGGINPGMSGGPAINEKGEVIGVNVATAGNQVGFLVPMPKLRELLDEYRSRGKSPVNWRERIRQQLFLNQKNLMQTMFSYKWFTVAIGKAEVLGEIFPFVQCWGGSNSDKNKPYLTISRACQTNERLYLSSNFDTGIVEYEYSWVESRTLNSVRFYKYVQSLLSSAQAGNRTTKQFVSNYECHESFVSKPNRRAVFCAREYKMFKGLYDVLYIDATVQHPKKALMSHFTLAGVSRENAQAFLERFMGSLKWAL